MTTGCEADARSVQCSPSGDPGQALVSARALVLGLTNEQYEARKKALKAAKMRRYRARRMERTGERILDGRFTTAPKIRKRKENNSEAA